MIAHAVHAAEFRAGAATSNITPDLGSSINGGFQDGKAVFIHDELHARCLALDDGKTKLVFVVADSCVIGRGIFDEAKKMVNEAAGLPVENMMMSATHSHSCGTLQAVGQSEPSPMYQRFVARRIADGVRCALNNLAPAKIGHGSASVPYQVFNRRWKMKPGTIPPTPLGITTDQVKTNPGINNPGLVEPAGPTDPEVRFISVQSTDGKPIALLANYSLHYVGGAPAGEVSADYYGEYARLMPSRLRSNGKLVAMMSNGTSGDINNTPFTVTRPPREPFEQIRIVAQKAADATWFALKKIDKHRADAPLGMLQREVTLKYRRPSEEDVQAAKAVRAVKDKAEIEKLPRLAQNYAGSVISAAERPEESITVKIQAIRIGDLAVCAIPFETFVEIGLDLKKRSPMPQTMVIGLANGRHGYLPTPEQHRLGGYETWIGTNVVQEDASVILTTQLLEMLAELKKP